MKILLPSQFDKDHISSFFLDTVSEERTPLMSSIELDFSALNFIKPTGVTILSNYIEWLKAHKVDVSYTGIKATKAPILFLDDSGFFERYLGKKISASAKTRSTTKPLEFISPSESRFWITNNLFMWLENNTKKSKASHTDLGSVLIEMFHNIDNHSGTNIGSIFAQHYPANKELSISMSDIGVGIPYNIRKYGKDEFRDYSDSDAIIKSCEDGFTTASTATNAGRGLATLISSITNYYNGIVTIVSDKGYVKFANDGEVIEKRDRKWIYPGCLIDISINPDYIPNREEYEEFIW